MRGEPQVSFWKSGHLLKIRGLVGKNRVPAWEIALGLVLYQHGLSFRKTAKVLGLLGRKVSHVAVWYWNKGVGERGLKLHQGSLPSVIVVDETRVKVGGEEAWIFVALDPRTLKVIYLEPFFVWNEATADLSLEHLVEAYGEWPREVITDGGPWYRAAFSFWEIEGKEDFDRYSDGLGRWLRSFAVP